MHHGTTNELDILSNTMIWKRKDIGLSILRRFVAGIADIILTSLIKLLGLHWRLFVIENACILTVKYLNEKAVTQPQHHLLLRNHI
ncbi:hypothetical protein PPSC2_12360 [Paenibacillus polymyxa SC2]|uniref:Uncharacterized protein n=1 Tax=Paenibacillus polymyxa (strain SC2) TaxID=886882 RepID=A0A0D5ZC72_PAEPS|nr:hypothetical protein PPSC2_12360 [Paenibacillus polymyxa SC2]